jgi:hypothetical protein
LFKAIGSWQWKEFDLLVKFVYFKCYNSFGNSFAHDHAKDIQNHPDSLGFFVIYKDFMEVTLFDEDISELHILFFRKLG